MKFFNFLLPISICLSLTSCGHGKRETQISKGFKAVSQKEKTFKVIPIQHATMILEWNGIIVYVDPVGGKRAFEDQQPADLILITDIHSNHFSLKTLLQLNTAKAKIMIPQVVADSIPSAFTPQLDVLGHGEKKERFGITVEAIPMHNIKKEVLKSHEKGLGNGYVLELEGERIYISGETKYIPETSTLEDIDKAFVCLNLSNNRTIERAADAVLKFQPKQVYPYNYHNSEGFSDMQKFKALVNQANNKIDVKLLDWYKQ